MHDHYGRLLVVKDVLPAAFFLLALVTAWFNPAIGSRLCVSIERWGSRVSANRVAAILIVAALVIMIRVSLLGVVKIPDPAIHDEFSYLLAGDTFAHGRLTNPPHSMWVFFETFHVNQLPTYASKYPPAQGALLALGEMFGHPWIGVLLSVGCLCGAITWALQGWVPARWAFLGGLLLATLFSPRHYWINSYWGGAVAGIGGALVVGAFPRILSRRRIRDSIVFAVGIGILGNSRPYEGGILSLIFVVALAWKLASQSKGSRTSALGRVLIPVTACLLCVAAFDAYYNWRVTGSPTLLPYAVNNRAYMSVPAFQWQKLGPPLQYRNPQFDSFYHQLRLEWYGERLNGTWAGLKQGALLKLGQLQGFYAPVELGAAMAVGLFSIRRNPKVRFCAFSALAFVIGVLGVTWLLPHYAAPGIALVYVLIVFGFRYLRGWCVAGRPVGLAFTRLLVVCHFVVFFLKIISGIAHDRGPTPMDAWPESRAYVDYKLEHTPGRHLVVVRYSPKHNPAEEWVYNRADIDNAKVIWAREIPGRDMKPLLDYFHGRDLWIAEPDALPSPDLQPVQEAQILRH